MSGGPLSGVRVVDLTQMLAGPFTTMLLADLGADVIKVEPPQGDETRKQGPHLADDDLHSYGGYFQSVNRSKKSVSLDLKSEGGHEALLTLVDHADILVENFRVGVMDRLGLSYESLHERNPALVYVAVRGFGDPRTGASPYQNWPAFDVVAQAMGGLVGMTGATADSPTKAGPGIGDIFPGTLAATGALAALLHARSTGEGQFVDVAMYDGVLALCERMAFQFSYGQEIAGPSGNSHPLLSPFGVFPASDGWVAVAAPRNHQWADLARLMGYPQLAADERFEDNQQRVKHRAEVDEVVSGWTSARTREEIAEVLGGVVPFGPVNTAERIFADPHVAARGMLAEVPHAGSGKTVRIVNSPIKFTQTPTEGPVRAPILGEHTRELLLAAGCDEAQVQSWIRSGNVLDGSIPTMRAAASPASPDRR